MREIKILFLADHASPALWDYFDSTRLEGVDLIVSCGDLPPQYLSFLATFFTGPVLYIYGNHDDCYQETPPGGCTCIDGEVYVYENIRIAGLGGSMRYRPGEHQYTERQMRVRVRRLKRKLRRHKGVDIFIAHAPAYGLGDGQDLPHRGFQCFFRLFEKYRPRYFVHGHMHLTYDPTLKRTIEHEGITIINAYERYMLDYKPEDG